MSNINNIINPVKNGQTRDSRLFVFDNKGYSDITISVISDRNLTLVLHQSYNELEFTQSEPVEYLAADGNKVFNFSKDGEIFFFTLTNTSGVDCVFTRAFADFTVSRTNINDLLTHNKLDTLNGNISALNQSLVNLQKQSPVYYRELGDAYYITSPEFNTSLTPLDELVIYNPVGSGKTIYLYHVSFFGNVDGASAATYNATVIAEKISNYNEGINVISSFKGNLNLGLQNDSVLEVVTKPTSITGQGRIFRKNINHSADSNIINYQREFLEIPPGLGVNFRVNSSSVDVSMNFNLRYFEEAEDAPDVIELLSIIPDVNPAGDPILTDQSGFSVYTWGFTTGNGTLYDLFSLTNSFTTGDDEKITTLYVASDTNQTNLLLNGIFVSTGGITVNDADGELLFAPNMADSTNPQGNITLQPNTSFEFKVTTTFNDNDAGAGGPDIQLAIVERDSGDVKPLQYLDVVTAQT